MLTNCPTLQVCPSRTHSHKQTQPSCNKYCTLTYIHSISLCSNKHLWLVTLCVRCISSTYQNLDTIRNAHSCTQTYEGHPEARLLYREFYMHKVLQHSPNTLLPHLKHSSNTLHYSVLYQSINNLSPTHTHTHQKELSGQLRRVFKDYLGQRSATL